MTGQRGVVAIRVEGFRVLPLRRIEARRLVRRHDIAEPLLRRRPHFGQRRFASAVRRDGAEQLHDEALKWCEGVAAGVVRASSMAFLNKARASGSPVSLASLSMMLYIVLPIGLTPRNCETPRTRHPCARSFLLLRRS